MNELKEDVKSFNRETSKLRQRSFFNAEQENTYRTKYSANLEVAKLIESGKLLYAPQYKNAVLAYAVRNLTKKAELNNRVFKLISNIKLSGSRFDRQLALLAQVRSQRN